MEKESILTIEQLSKLPKDALISLCFQFENNFQELLKNQEDLKRQIATLQEAVLVAQQNRFGRKTEKSDQLEGQITLSDLGFSDMIFNESEKAVEDGMPEEPAYEEVVIRRKKQKGKQEQDLSGLPVETVSHELSDEDLEKEFPDGYTRLNDEVYHEVIFEPAVLKVVEHRIAVYTGKHSTKMLKGPRPARLLPHSLLSSSLASAIWNVKFVNAVPYNRFSTELESYGLKISRQKMAGWMIKISERYMSILYDRMRKELLKSRLINADETPFVVSRENEGRSPGAKSYMWVYFADGRNGSPPICLYDYCKTRGAIHPEQFLAGYEGILETDGYQVYHKLAEDSSGSLIVAGCWSHAARRFKTLCKALGSKAASGSVADEAVRRIQAIYHTDNMMKNASPEARLEHRQSSVKPLVDAYFAWVKDEMTMADKHSETGKALQYSLNQEPYLRKFLDDPIIPLDNNDAEREGIRPFTVGRKNWTIVDSKNGAQASAVLYSIAQTAKMNNLKPYTYFKYVLDHMPERMDQPMREDLFDDLLPWSPEAQAACEKR